MAVRHLGRYSRYAANRRPGWEWLLALMGKPLYDVRYFDRSEAAAAWAWVYSGESNRAADGVRGLRRVVWFEHGRPARGAALGIAVGLGFLAGVVLRSSGSVTRGSRT